MMRLQACSGDEIFLHLMTRKPPMLPFMPTTLSNTLIMLFILEQWQCIPLINTPRQADAPGGGII